MDHLKKFNIAVANTMWNQRVKETIFKKLYYILYLERFHVYKKIGLNYSIEKSYYKKTASSDTFKLNNKNYCIKIF